MNVESPHGHHTPAGGHTAMRGERDPVCGMSVDPATAKYWHVHRGKTYHFCGAPCRDKFVADPESYLGPPAAKSPARQATPGFEFDLPDASRGYAQWAGRVAHLRNGPGAGT